MTSIIKVEKVSKAFTISHESPETYTTLRDVMARKVKKVFSFSKSSVSVKKSTKERFWALKDVSFEVNQGDRLAIIGRNGAGKSTMLKVLSRITQPTAGRIEIGGRVASLLEVGTGFHPELTGRENIFLNGAILGMSRSEIRQKFDEIVDFAEVEKFLDTPVKRYSSGMYVRLAFAVAAHLEPEILVVDEVLAVGDVQFQKKCLGKMEDVSTREGRTVLFVSHNMSAVKALCDKALLLANGQVVNYAGVEEIVNQYIRNSIFTAKGLEPGNKEGIGNEYIRLLRFDVIPAKGNSITVESGINIEIEFLNRKPGINLDTTLLFYAMDDTCLFETGCLVSDNNDAKNGKYMVKAYIPPYLFNAGTYKMNLIFGENQAYVIWRINDAVTFDVENTLTDRGANVNVPPGYMRPKTEWSKQLIADA